MHAKRGWVVSSIKPDSSKSEVESAKELRAFMSWRAALLRLVPSIQEVMAQLEQQIKTRRNTIKQHLDSHRDLRGKWELLESIPGIGRQRLRKFYRSSPVPSSAMPNRLPLYALESATA